MDRPKDIHDQHRETAWNAWYEWLASPECVDRPNNYEGCVTFFAHAFREMAEAKVNMHLVVDPLMPPGTARLVGRNSEVTIRNIGESERAKHEEIAANIQRATEMAIRTQAANLEAQIRAVPEELRDQYHIRVQMHRDGSQTQHFERKDTPARICTCQVYIRAMYSLDGLPVVDAIRRLQELTGTYYKDVSHLCLHAGNRPICIEECV
jgi:hypothetical protein